MYSKINFQGSVIRSRTNGGGIGDGDDGLGRRKELVVVLVAPVGGLVEDILSVLRRTAAQDVSLAR